MQKSDKIVTISLLGALALAFGGWALTRADGSVAGMFAAVASALLFGCILLRWVPGALEAFRTPQEPYVELSPRRTRRGYQHPWVRLALILILGRLALFIVAYAVYTLANGYQGGILDTLKTLWLRTDSPSYLGIAQNWYVTEGDPRFHIVFFPFYPVLIKAVWFLTRNYFASAMIVSNLCGVAAGIVFYELLSLDMPRSSAFRGVKYLMLFPGAFFFLAPMTESLFLLLSVTAVYLARKKRYLWACLLAALAGFTRSPGILLFLPIAYEMALDLVHTPMDPPARKKAIVRRALCLCIVPLGLMAYLFINYAVTGSAFTFAVYQREHWSQGPGWFFNTAKYQAEYLLTALNAGNWQQLWGLYLPNLICQFAALGVAVKTVKKLRPSYALYFLASYAMTIGAAWLLSAPRYLSVVFPLAIGFAQLGKNKGMDWVLTVLCAAGLVNYMAMYVLGFPVY